VEAVIHVASGEQMRVIGRRIWTEPAVAIGLLTSILLTVVALVTGTSWDTSTIAGIAAPFLSSLGIRQFVSPTDSKAQSPSR